MKSVCLYSLHNAHSRQSFFMLVSPRALNESLVPLLSVDFELKLRRTAFIRTLGKSRQGFKISTNHMDQMPSRETNDRVRCLDWLRGLAALLIVLAHIPHRGPSWGDPTDPYFWLYLPFELGSFRTVLFVMIAGFAVHLLTLKKLGLTQRIQTEPMPILNWHLDWKKFWQRRLRRLYGPYIFAVAGSLLFLGVVAWRNHAVWRHYLAGGRDWAADVLCHVFLVHNLNPDYAIGMCNGPLWALALEIQLCMLYFGFLWLRRRCSRQTAYGVVLLVSLAGWQTVQVFAPERLTWHFWSIGRWELWPFNFWWIWTLGALGAEAYCGLTQVPAWLRSARVGTSLLILGSFLQFPMWEYMSGGQRFGPWLAQAAPAGIVIQSLLAVGLQIAHFAVAPLGVAALFFWLLAAEQTWLSKYGPVRLGLIRLGRVSYSLFLTHAPMIWLGEIVLSRLAGRPIDLTPTWILVRLAVYLPACLVGAWVFHLLCEKPFHSQPALRPARPQNELPNRCPPAGSQHRQAA